MIAEEFRKKQHFSATSEIKMILDLEKNVVLETLNMVKKLSML